MAAQLAKATSAKATAGGFHQAVTAPVFSSIAAGTLNATPTSKTPAITAPAGKAGASSGKAGKTAAVPAPGEIEIPAKLPLIEAITTLGGPQILLGATELELVVTKFPKGDAKAKKASSENRFVQGLRGKVAAATSTTVTKEGKKIPITLKKGDTFRIRWDFVPGEAGTGEEARDKGELAKDPVVGKGLHINAEYGIGTGNAAKNKIAFMPEGSGPVVDKDTARNPVRFDQIVKDQSTFLGYDTKVNTLEKVFTVEERLHGASSTHTDYPADQKIPSLTSAPGKSTVPTAGATREAQTSEIASKLNAQAAKKLAERWAEMCKTGKEDDLSSAMAGATKANEAEKEAAEKGGKSTAPAGAAGHAQVKGAAAAGGAGGRGPVPPTGGQPKAAPVPASATRGMPTPARR